MTRGNDADKRIAAVLADGPLTVRQIAVALSMEQHGVLSALRGMVNRHEAVRLKPATLNKPWRYRLRAAEQAA